MLVFTELMHVPKPVGGARGGGEGPVCTARTTPFPKKKALQKPTYHGRQKSAPPPTCMQVYYKRVSSLPKGLVVADFLMHTPRLATEQHNKHDNMH